MNRSKFRAAAAIYTVLIIAVSALPSRGVDTGIPHADKILHFIMFAILALLAGSAGRVRILPLIAWIAGAGAASELVQFLAPGRDPDFLDWLADIAGGAAGLLPMLGQYTVGDDSPKEKDETR